MDLTKIYIYGGGGHGLVVSDIAKAVGYKQVVVLDDKSDAKFHKDLEKADIFIAVGDNKARQTLTKLVKNANFNIVSLIHPSAVISPSATIKDGVVVMPNAVINANAVIKDGAIINSSSVIEHECIIESFAHISPKVALAGGVKVGSLTHIGIGSSVIQGISIGSNCIIGAGSVVVCDIGDNTKAFGVPAKAR